MRTVTFLCLCYLIHAGTSLSIIKSLHKTRDKLRGKINKILKKQKGDEFFLDINEFEYPRANETYREINKQLWEDYYSCLRRRHADIGLEKTIYPNALVVLEGTSVTLQCQICISPAEIHAIDTVEWYFNSSVGDARSRIVEPADHVLISEVDRQLTMYNVKEEQSGRYWCQMGDTVSTVHFLSVDTDTDSTRHVRPETAPLAPHAEPPKVLSQHRLKIHTTWTDWSACSACNSVGRKVRYGYCVLSLLEGTEHRYIANESVPAQHEETERASEAIEEILKEELRTVLLLFRNKLPCKSRYVPEEVQKLPEVSEWRTEMMVRYCKRKCPRNEIFQVRDRQGNVIESANNSAGIYSMLQGMPQPSPPVARVTIYRRHDKEARLVCPGNLNTDAPVVWKASGKVLNPSVLEDGSDGRVRVNSQMHLVFEKLRFGDTNIYSCWQNDQIAGIIKLTVTGEVELEMNQHAFMIGGILIVLVFLIVFWRAFRGRKRFTMH